MNRFFKILIVFLLFSLCLQAQQDNEKSLLEKVLNNQYLLRSDSEKAYENILILLEEAIATGNQVSELTLLANICRYHSQHKNIAELIKASDNLHLKAIQYRDREFEVIAKRYMAEAYGANGMYLEAIEELKDALRILDKIVPQTDNTHNTRANIYISTSNFYKLLKQPETSIKYLKLTDKENKKIKDTSQVSFLEYLNNSNLAAAYLNINIDSAAYYVKKSIDIKPAHMGEDDIMIRNYLLLGTISMRMNEIDSALYYFQNSEELIIKTGVRTNLADAYTALIEYYKMTGDHSQEQAYINKLREHEIEQNQNRNRSLHKIIEKERTDRDLKHAEYKKNIILISIISVFIILITWISFYFHRKRLYEKHEKISADYLAQQENQEKINTTIYSEIIEKVKQNDKSFMISFNETFPDFSNKLLAINPKLVQSEIEFCALLKLNLSTKEIATYRYIQPKTVQNKKYHIRKRLNIPDSMDIYNWFNNM